MKIGNDDGLHPRILLMVAIAITVITAALSVWNNSWTQIQNQQVISTIKVLDNLRGQITYQNEVMIMAATLAAQTGHPKWQQRHSYLGPLLAENIKNTLLYSQFEDRQRPALAAELLQTHHRLRSLENTVFNFIDQQELLQARQVLESKVYTAAKKQYGNTLSVLYPSLEAYNQGTAQAQRRSYNQMNYIAAGIAVLLIVMWCWAYVLFVRFQSRQDRSLLDSEARLDILFDNIDANILVFDIDGLIETQNSSVIGTFGYSADQIAGRLISDVILGDVLLACQQGAANENGVIFEKKELLGCRRDASTLQLQVSVSRVVRAHSPRFVLIALDLTGTKATELALTDARHRAEQASRAKSEFLSTMSHEIRTPLNGVIGYSSLFAQTTLTDQQQKMMDGIKASSETLLTIVNDILDFSKIEAKSIELEHCIFQLNSLLNATQDIFQSQLLQSATSLTYTISDDVPEYLFTDPSRLKQIITNLLSNSLKFTNQGQVSLSVELLEKNANAILLQFSVTDTGIGISKERQDYLFDAFIQEDASISRRFGGTGLGLTISKELVKLMGGDIKVTSEEGKGTTFYFTIRADIASQTAVDEFLSRKPPVEITDVVIDYPLRVLVAEDNKVNQHIVTSMLVKIGYKPDVVDNGQEAIDAISEKPYDLIYMDVQMPVCDGLQAMREIRSKIVTEDQPIIVALTANAFEQQKKDCFEAGADRFVAKPFTFSDIQGSIIDTISQLEMKDKMS